MLPVLPLRYNNHTTTSALTALHMYCTNGTKCLSFTLGMQPLRGQLENSLPQERTKLRAFFDALNACLKLETKKFRCYVGNGKRKGQQSPGNKPVWFSLLLKPLKLSPKMQSTTHLINQSINQSINRSVNRSIDQSIDQSINPSINQLIDQQSINQSTTINESVNQPQSMNLSINYSINQSIKVTKPNQSISHSINQSTNQPINKQSINRSIICNQSTVGCIWRNISKPILDQILVR